MDGATIAADPTAEALKRHQPFITLATEARELYLEREISRITPPSSLDFYREYVAKNRPVIITDALNDWPALHLWPRRDYLRKKVGSTVVTIDRVPVSSSGQGLGDSVVDGYFVTPSEEQMPFAQFLDHIERKDKDPAEGVLYCQHQNSSLTEEFASLCEDVPELSWATNAFNANPDAVNVWCGEDRSVSTLHHDPYENMYCVVTGVKQFLLYPPSDYHWLDKREYPKASWQYDAPDAAAAASSADASATSASATAAASSSSSAPSRFSLVPDPDGARTAWFNLEPQGPEGCIPVDSSSAPVAPAASLRVSPDAELPLPPPGPYPPHSTHPPMPAELRAEYATPMWVELHAGETLYLPSLWFHRVSQRGDETGKTIAVNFWYDAAYDSRYTAFRFQEQVSNDVRDAHATTAAAVTP